VAFRLPSGTILFLPPATHRPRPQHPHSPFLPRSPPRIVAAHLVLPPTVDLVTTTAPAHIDPNAACASSSQPPSSRRCDEHLNPPYERRFLLITANQPFGEWGKIFADQAMTLATIDRLVHHATILEMNVESYRRRAALQRKRGKTVQPS
jgi:hypothetical protein